MEIRKEELRLGIREAYLSDLRGYAASRSDSKGIVSSSKNFYQGKDVTLEEDQAGGAVPESKILVYRVARK